MKSGLRLRPTFEGIVDYIANGQETIKYPDRLAKFMRNHPYLTQLDGEGVMEMQEQQENVWKEQEKEHRVKELSTKGTQSAPEVRTQMRNERGMASSTQTFDLRQQDMDMSEMMDVTEEEMRKRQREARERAERKRQNIIQTIARQNGSDPGVVPFAAAAAAASRSRTPPTASTPAVAAMKQERMVRSRSPRDKKEDKKIDTKGNVKIEGVAAPKMAVASSSSRGKKRAVSADSVLPGAVKPGPKRDMAYWTSEATANEMRSQIILRKGGDRRDYGVKNRQQLLDMIRQMMNDGTW
jgi:hypothetical protein